MAKKRDFIDDIIDIQQDWQAVQNPLGNLAGALVGDAPEEPTWNPADYKERPRANTIPCPSCQHKDDGYCTACVDVCPVGAIQLDEGAIEIADTCRKCGLCVSACKSECFITKSFGSRKLYDTIATAASAHEEAYVTCTRALGRVPKANEVVLPCVGVVAPEVWFALLCDFDNINVYLPLGICDKCRNAGGEDVFSEAIAAAEEWSGSGMGLEVDEADLDHEVNRNWQRKQFFSNMANAGGKLLGGANPVIGAVQAVKTQLDAHTKKINELERTLEAACGVTSTQRKRRVLTQRRQLLLEALQRHPKVAKNVPAYLPTCDTSMCTQCGACVDACPTHAVDITANGLFRAEVTHCNGCGACIYSCPEHALTLESALGTDLVVLDPHAADREKAEAEQKAKVEQLKKEGRAKLMKGLDMLEKLDSSDDKE